jgi:hypothetical protein
MDAAGAGGARGIPLRSAARDLGVLAAALGAFALDARLRAGGGAAAAAMGCAAGVLAASAGYLAHEWGHLAGARLGGSVVRIPDSPRSVFLFHFDSDRNSRRQFPWMSLGGFAASAFVVALSVAVLPLDALSGRVAVALVGLGVLATAVLELPPFFRVLRGGAIPRGGAYASSPAGSGR